MNSFRNTKTKRDDRRKKEVFYKKHLLNESRNLLVLAMTSTFVIILFLTYMGIEIVSWETVVSLKENQLIQQVNRIRRVFSWLMVLGGILVGIIVLLIRVQKKVHNKFFQLVYYDELTELPNRRFFEDILLNLLEDARKSDQKIAVIYIDLDNFKMVNDTLGHGLGDITLNQIGKLIKQCLRKDDMISRFEGDEFAVVLRGIDQKSDLVHILEKIIHGLQAPFVLNEKRFYITASMGVAIYPDDAGDMKTLIRYADMAMNRAKETGKNRYYLFESQISTKRLEKYELEEDLRQALKREEFVLYYQPQIHIDTGKMVGVEALIRWIHPTKGCIPPMKFIPLAEETGFIIPIGEWVLRTACRQSVEWRKKGFPDLRVSVNLSAKQFQQPNLIDKIMSILEETNMKPELLDLEITESIAMIDLELTKRNLQFLRSKHINISLDDFGTGYSSLNYLKQLPINTVKMDKTFVDNITEDKNQQTIAKAVIDLSHNMELGVTAEGVETWEQLSFLRIQKCDRVQGYLFSMPLPLAQIENMIAQDKGFIPRNKNI